VLTKPSGESRSYQAQLRDYPSQPDLRTEYVDFGSKLGLIAERLSVLDLDLALAGAVRNQPDCIGSKLVFMKLSSSC